MVIHFSNLCFVFNMNISMRPLGKDGYIFSIERMAGKYFNSNAWLYFKLASSYAHTRYYIVFVHIGVRLHVKRNVLERIQFV